MQLRTDVKFHVMRHGRSLANEAGLIVSDPGDGAEGWGLASGAEKAVVASIEASGLPSGTLVVSSPFLRTRETADIAANLLESPEVRIEDGLRERYFGKWDGGVDDRYAEAWAWDERGDGESPDGVESTSSVLERLLGVLSGLTVPAGLQDVLIVSHGDPMNILLAHAAGLSSREHRKIEGMKTAEIRCLDLAGASVRRP